MSTGRWVKRGRTFQGRAKAVWALAGPAVLASTDPVAGWVANQRNRHWVGYSVTRQWIAATVNRLWIARSDNG